MSSFIDSWNEFLSNVERLAEKKFEADGDDLKAQHLRPALESVMKELFSAEPLIADAAAREAQVVRDTLRRELDYVNARCASALRSGGTLAAVDRCLEDGDTVKGSIESLLENLPGWVKKVLELLNELLKLLRG